VACDNRCTASAFNIVKIFAVRQSLTSSQDARQSQWQVAQNGSDKIFEFFVRRPTREQESFEPPRQLHVAMDRLASFRDSKTNK
jgi:hypothetical protein